MIINTSYSLPALHEAAKFIWENNLSVKSWHTKPEGIFDVMKDIQEMIRRGAADNAKVILKERQLKVELPGEWMTYCGTGGYYIVFELEEDTEEEITIGATILVDPAISVIETGFVTECIDEIEEEVVQ